MAAISSSIVTVPLGVNPSLKLTSLSSSSSVFFNYSTSNRAGIKLSVDRAKRRGLSCNCLFGLGVPEIAVIVGVSVLVFGPKQLPEVGRSIGKTVKSFQQAAKEFETELKKEPEASADPSTDTELKKEPEASADPSTDTITTPDEEQEKTTVPTTKDI